MRMENLYIVFAVGSNKYMVPIEKIEGIETVDNVLKTSKSSLKVMIQDGKGIPIIDIEAMLSFNEHETSMESKVILFHEIGYRFGILCDRILEIKTVYDSSIVESKFDDLQFVSGRSDGLEILEPRKFVREDLKPLFKQLREKDMSALEDSWYLTYEKRAVHDERLEQLRHHSVKLILDAIKRKADRSIVHNLQELYKQVKLIS